MDEDRYLNFKYQTNEIINVINYIDQFGLKDMDGRNKMFRLIKNMVDTMKTNESVIIYIHYQYQKPNMTCTILTIHWLNLSYFISIRYFSTKVSRKSFLI